MKIAVFLDLVPQEYLQIKKTTTIRSIKKYLEKYNNIEKIQFFVNDQTESKILNTDKYDKYNLSSIWKKLKEPAIYLYTPDPFKYTAKDMVLKIMSQMNDEDLLNFCKTNNQRDAEGVLYCNNEEFWKNRFIQKYGKTEKDKSRTWKNFYKVVKYYADKFQTNIQEAKEQILKEKSDIFNFFSNYLGQKAFEKVLKNIDNIDSFTIYTGFKNSPVSWDSSIIPMDNYMRNYPDYPGKPKFSDPITDEEFVEFTESLRKHFKVEYADDILTIEKENGKFVLRSERMDEDEEEILTKEELLNILNETFKYYRIEIIDETNFPDLNFDLRDYLAEK